MQREEMESELRTRRWAVPKKPYVIELINGERIEIDDPEAVAFDGGAGGFINAQGEPIDFECEEIVRIYDAVPELFN